jgi:hypothetical protein
LKYECSSACPPKKKVLFSGVPGKMLWVFMQPFFYGVRPMIDKPKPLTITELLNWVVVGGSDLLVLHFLGVRSLVYLFAGEGNYNNVYSVYVRTSGRLNNVQRIEIIMFTNVQLNSA